jgi:hypothetical protein
VVGLFTPRIFDARAVSSNLFFGFLFTALIPTYVSSFGVADWPS